jgi:hypothetical protein
VPGTSASALVAFAIISGRPDQISAGKVTSVPPPATELSIPAIIAAPNSNKP